ncbi:hypothetical protein RFI_22536 [Reticulomyxa filosa]|uniref:Uncharacterized protein n=1 Tax=Reticulomyxa filosa TaxID=46433 RepID=X6MLE1_RETFI|nr:hypothetical protein RFI_22536 [Reticulomyxa filosa]|eukprot:ETO14833.1 hypothetical protein RFI_22536 [Reticulomyxa filosa]
MELVLRTRFSLTTIIYFSKLTSLQYAVCIEHMKYEVIVEQGLWGGKKKETQDEGRNIREKQRHISALFKDVGKYMLVKNMTDRNSDLIETLNALPILHSLDYVCDISKEANNVIEISANTGNVSSDLLMLDDIFPKNWTMILFGYLILLALFLIGEICTFWFVYDIHSLISYSSVWKMESRGWNILLCLAAGHALFALLVILITFLHFQDVVVQVNQNISWAYDLEKKISDHKSHNPNFSPFLCNFNQHLYLANMEKACYHYFIVRYIHSIYEDWMSQSILQFLYGSTLEWPAESAQSETARDQVQLNTLPNSIPPAQGSDSNKLIVAESSYNEQHEFSGNKAAIAYLIRAILEF